MHHFVELVNGVVRVGAVLARLRLDEPPAELDVPAIGAQRCPTHGIPARHDHTATPSRQGKARQYRASARLHARYQCDTIATSVVVRTLGRTARRSSATSILRMDLPALGRLPVGTMHTHRRPPSYLLVRGMRQSVDYTWVLPVSTQVYLGATRWVHSAPLQQTARHSGNAAAEAIHVGGRLWPTFERKPCGRMRQRDSPAHHPLENGRRRAGHECERGCTATSRRSNRCG